MSRVLVLIAILGTVLLGQAAARAGTPAPLIAIVDAGSSGSRLFLYRAEDGPGLPNLMLLTTSRDAKRPLAFFAGPEGRPSDAGALGVGPLLQALSQHLSDAGLPRGDVTVHVLGTGGMRALPKPIAEEIYASTAAAVVHAGYQLGRTLTISGEHEAIYAWLDVNYLQNTFKEGVEPWGVIEIGGASAQVAMAVPPTDAPKAPQFRLNGITYAVVAASYLGLGQNEARRAMIADSTSGGVGANVCYPHSATAETETFDTGIPGLMVAAATSQYTSQCAEVYGALIVHRAGLAERSSVPPAHFARLASDRDARFVGISLIDHIFNEWKVVDEADPAQRLHERISTLCSGTDAWSRVLQWYGQKPTVFAQNACANATFVHALLYGDTALALRASQVRVASTVAAAPLTWSRGAALLAALAAFGRPAELPPTH